MSRDGEVPDESCEQPKPLLRTRPCNTHHCSYKWQKSEWSTCSDCEQRRKIWCGLESRRWEEKPLMAASEKCSESDGFKPPIKRLCSFECTRKCGGKRSTRSAHDFIENFKNLNIIMIQPGVVCDNVYVDHEPLIESGAEQNEGNDDDSSVQFSVEQPVMMRTFEQRNARKVVEGPVVVDKMEKVKIKNIPMIKSKEQKLSDETFRTLGDKVSDELNVELQFFFFFVYLTGREST